MSDGPVNPFISRQSRIGQVGRKAEKKSAERFGARLTPASGAAISKGDFVTRDMLFENKITVNASLGLRYDWLTKITEEALMVGKAPALAFGFVDASGRPHRYGSWVAVPEAYFRELQLAAKKMIDDGQA